MTTRLGQILRRAIDTNETWVELPLEEMRVFSNPITLVVSDGDKPKEVYLFLRLGDIGLLTLPELRSVHFLPMPEEGADESAYQLIMRDKERLLNDLELRLNAMTVFLEYLLPRPPVSVYWLDYFATNRTCALDTIPRVFNLLPARLSQRLDFLQAQNWRRVFWRSVLGR